MTNKKLIRRVILILLALYGALFAARFAFDLAADDIPLTGAGGGAPFMNMQNSVPYVQNFASDRKVYKAETGTQVLDQKYERIASISAKTAAYDDDLAKLNAAVEGAQAVIQMENEQGLPGSRRLTRTIGVTPEGFDACLEAVRAVGVPISSTSQKIDKTYEYRQMLAQKQELEKRLASYVALRSEHGSINEKINLEDKIIEVESQLLRQDVDLGEYKDENALCTINVSLYEGSQVNVAQKLLSAFRWTNSFYFSLLGAAVALCLAAVVLIKSWRFLSSALTVKAPESKGREKDE